MDAFISHVEEDCAVATQLAGALEAAGVKVWYYERDSLPGPPYLEQVGEAIERCEAVVLIVSVHALSSNQVTNEIVRAYESRKPFVPLLHGVSHAEMQQRQPTWRQCLGASTSLAIPEGKVEHVVERTLAGLRALGVGAVPSVGIDGPGEGGVVDDGAAETGVAERGVLAQKVRQQTDGVQRVEPSAGQARRGARFPVTLLMSRWLLLLAAVVAAVAVPLGVLLHRSSGGAAETGGMVQSSAKEVSRETPQAPIASARRPAYDGKTCTVAGIEFAWIPPEPLESAPRADTEGFWLGKYEVTQAQWQAVMEDNPSEWKGDNLPVGKVTWDRAQEFVGKLRASENRSFRLPTSYEWLRACRAGTTSAYCFGDDESELGNYEWYEENSEGQPHPVGMKKPNPWGLYDMHGNMREWCQDLYGVRHDLRTVRGGSYVSDASSCRSSAQAGAHANEVFAPQQGFRLAMDVEPRPADTPMKEVGVREGEWHAYEAGNGLLPGGANLPEPFSLSGPAAGGLHLQDDDDCTGGKCLVVDTSTHNTSWVGIAHSKLSPFGREVSNEAGYAIEARVRTADSARQAGGVMFSDGVHQCEVIWADDGVKVCYVETGAESPIGAKQIPLDMTDGYHTVRIAVQGDTVSVAIDGEERLSATLSVGPCPNPKFISWGRANSEGANTPGLCYWDYFRYCCHLPPAESASAPQGEGDATEAMHATSVEPVALGPPEARADAEAQRNGAVSSADSSSTSQVEAAVHTDLESMGYRPREIIAGRTLGGHRGVRHISGHDYGASREAA